MKKLLIAALVLAFALSAAAGLAEGKTYVIGIAQFAVHGSLDNCREGFIEGLKENGFEEGANVRFEVQNAQADMGIAASIASAFVDNRVDMICAIATPMAVVSFNTADNKIPVIFTAVSEPVEAGLATPDGLGTGETTGTSDQLPVRKQLETIRAMLPEAKTVGILYTVGEVNSAVQLKQYEETAGDFGFAVVSEGISVGADIQLALPGLLKQADCLTMLTDNTVVQYLDVVLDASDEAGIPVFGSEVEQVVRGCVAAEGLDYIALGRQTGAMAARVLGGESAGSIPFETIRDSALYVSAEACERLGISLPEALEARANFVAAQD